MTDIEQLEAWIEKRILERRATRREVYALRAYRRSNNTRTRAHLVSAYLHAAVVRPLVPVFTRFAEQMVEASRKINQLVMRWQITEIEDADLGEFDNRARDWMRHP